MEADRQLLRDSNTADCKLLKQLEKQLKVKPNHALPSSFQKDGLDCILEVTDVFKYCNKFNNHARPSCICDPLNLPS